MLIVLKPGVTQDEIDHIVEKIKSLKLNPHVSTGVQRTIITVIGDEDIIREQPLEALAGVESVKSILRPFKLVSKETHPDRTVIKVGDVEIGGPRVVVMAGPCAVEGEAAVVEHARMIKKAGAKMFRAGAFKPRTSPYSFQGYGREGVMFMVAARQETGLPFVTEVMDPRDVEFLAEHADMMQIGTRNMQNYNLLKEVGRMRTPVLLKRGMNATINEFLMSAEYILAQGNRNVILCPRGIRTFEDITRNTLDAGAVPVVKELSHLPVICDPSHAMGIRDYVIPAGLAYIAAGADGLIVEAHPNPEDATSDGQQTVNYEQLTDLIARVNKVAKAIGRDCY
ncbi:MAG TPA: 3-deoxy-7-phosphoheptulonate synthase [Spirochaetota bacterium]|nr:3-deoxy-7-phosphoheptulonate synthase [Spirochaetota bacterium]HPI23732.1 3-deoxy-7-phosphoheptulonate synthase [Spirochaetota bacterium]HPU89335.1 3-deoxy-7-phosphoheptulonate synthase [Spirochaetota bacterium]